MQKKKIKSLQRTIRDGRSLRGEVDRAALSQGDEIFEIIVSFAGSDKQQVREVISLSWDQIFKIIGPSIYGFIVRKRGGYNQPATYPFQDNLEEHMRLMLIDRAQNRKVKIETSQIDTLVLQYKELGYLEFCETRGNEDETFRGVTLTEAGEKHLVRLSTRLSDRQ